MQQKNQISPRVERYSERRTLNVEFGFIVDVATGDEDSFYMVLVGKEDCVIPIDNELALLPLAHTAEELSSLYGAPEDLVGRRVRIEYKSHDWRRGICFLTAGADIASLGTSMEVPGRGFRYAVAGGGS